MIAFDVVGTLTVVLLGLFPHVPWQKGLSLWVLAAWSARYFNGGVLLSFDIYGWTQEHIPLVLILELTSALWYEANFWRRSNRCFQGITMRLMSWHRDFPCILHFWFISYPLVLGAWIVTIFMLNDLAMKHPRLYFFFFLLSLPFSSFFMLVFAG